MTDAIDIAFKIHCAVYRLQGSNVSNVMFDIYSSYSFDRVRNLVAEKLGRYPALVQLQWPLDTDKPKTPSTSIQDDEELNMFYERVRPFFTIKHTATGKISTRPRKNVLVHFEDGGLNINNIPPAGNNMKSTNTKSRSSSSKQKASNLDDKLEGSEDHKKYIVELQQKYMYEAHSRGSESPVYYYRQPGTNVCYALFHHNIAGWALEILCGNATVVQRPAGLLNLTARSRTRSSGATNSNMINPPDQQPPASTPVPTPFSYPYSPPAAPSVIVFPPSWGMAPQSQVTQYNTVPSTTPVSQPSKSPLPSPYASTSPLPPVGTTPIYTNPPMSALQYPDVGTFFDSLGAQVKKTPPGVNFSELGRKLEENGFLDISQVSCDYISVEQLKDLLQIQVGTAIFIFQRVDLAIQAVQAGQWVPSADF
ncbi:hypothetical protein F5I97DRAFT_1928946 [Phlebopus sp. FC_14]|nr:hypothetical protein F5I97DRAFT_1928946 [Phlebopus sp. FC_14]